MQNLLQRLSKVLDFSTKHGSKDLIEQHLKRNKVLARDRVKLLIDRNSYFFELSKCAGFQVYANIETPSAGVICGVGRVHNLYTMIIANDVTVKGGTLFPISVKKQIRAMEIAFALRLPCIYLVDSGGAFLPLQHEIFPDKYHGGRSFFLQARMSSEKIPQISAILGSCVAGGAYVPAMCDETIIRNGTGSIFLGGPPLVKAATGEVVTNEELGGARVHCEQSGLTDYFVNSDEEAIEKIRESIFYLNEDETTYRRDFGGNDAELMEKLKREVLRNDPLPLQTVVNEITRGSFHEFKTKYGDSEWLKVGISKINNEESVGLFLLDDCRDGAVSHKDFIKASHFVQLCTQRNYPIVFFIRGGKTNDANIIKPFANMMRAVAASPVKKIAFLIGPLHGNVRMMFESRSFEVNFLFTWPNFNSQENPSQEEEIPALSHAALMKGDNVIDPADTLFLLYKSLKIMKQSVRANVSPLDIHYMAAAENNNNNANVYRF